MKWEKRDIINICKIVAFGIILYWLLQNIGVIGLGFKTLCGILSPFIAGAAIAFIINIPMTVFENKLFKSKKSKKKNKNKVSKWKRLLSIILSLVITLLIIVGIIFLVIPELVEIIGGIVSYLPQLLIDIRDVSTKLITEYPDVEGILINMQSNLESFNAEMIKELTAIGTNLVTSSFGVITSTISGIIDTVVAIIFAIYILMGKEKILKQTKRIIYAFLPEKGADKICQIATLSKESFSNFIAGQFTECIILGTLCALGMLILRIPYSLTVGALVAITAFIPIVGAFIGGFVGVILLLPISLGKAIMFLIFFIILQQTENNLIYPRVVGNKVGVPGILVLVAVAIGGSLGGVVGMVIGLPLTSVLYTLLRESTSRRLKEKEIE